MGFTSRSSILKCGGQTRAGYWSQIVVSIITFFCDRSSDFLSCDKTAMLSFPHSGPLLISSWFSSFVSIILDYSCCLNFSLWCWGDGRFSFDCDWPSLSYFCFSSGFRIKCCCHSELRVFYTRCCLFWSDFGLGWLIDSLIEVAPGVQAFSLLVFTYFSCYFALYQYRFLLFLVSFWRVLSHYLAHPSLLSHGYSLN